MMRKILAIMTIVFCGITCAGNDISIYDSALINKRIIYKRFDCDAGRAFPQMMMIPFFRRAAQISPNCQTYPSKNVSMAMIIFYHNWLYHFHDDRLLIKRMLEKVVIEWGLEKKEATGRGFYIDGKKNSNSKLIGLVMSPTMIWVYQGDEHRISETSLIHELVHLSIRAAGFRGGDPDHEGPKYLGWTPAHTKFINETKDILRVYEI